MNVTDHAYEIADEIATREETYRVRDMERTFGPDWFAIVEQGTNPERFVSESEMTNTDETDGHDVDAWNAWLEDTFTEFPRF